MVQWLHLERMLCSWSPASQQKRLDLFSFSIKGGKSTEIFLMLPERHDIVCVKEKKMIRGGERRQRKGQVIDVTNLQGRVAAVYLPEYTRGSGGEKSDTKPKQDHILVCQTSAFLSNPHTESLIIPPCCSPTLCLSLPLARTHSLNVPMSLAFFGVSCCVFLWTDFFFYLNHSCFFFIWIQIPTNKITIYL